jgi:pimeloyl-ACP methyl ester carboxylesterase
MKMQYPVSRGAAAYSRSSQWKLTVPWAILWFLIVLEFILWHQESQFLVNILFWTIAISISLNAAYLGFESKVLTTFFKIESRFGHEISDPDWRMIEFTGWGGSEPMGYFIPAKGETKGLILYMHGYSSSVGYAENRILHLRDLGFDVAGIDMRGHGRCDLNRDWTLLKVAADIEAFMDCIISEYKEAPPVHFYGHSMGGFLALRLSSKKSGWWGDQLESVILESPAASIPMIVKMRAGPLWKPSRFLIRRIIRKEAKRIHPDLPLRFMDAKVPQIGLPNIPVLTLQSKVDDTLGRSHYNLVRKYLKGNSENEFHLISDLKHSTEFDSTTRMDLLERWLSDRS